MKSVPETAGIERGADRKANAGPVTKGSLAKSIYGIFVFSFYFFNTVFWCLLLYLFAIVKCLLPFPKWKRMCSHVLDGIGMNWIGVNNIIQRIFSPMKVVAEVPEDLARNEWYLVLANHQSWVDILVMHRVFYRRIPFLKFFLKKELIWFPFLGLAWWALDFPFMKRYSKSYLKKHPHLMGRDFDIARKATEKFKTIPVSVMNFVEGTRFTPGKHQKQKSPYTHLLRTRAGGIAMVLSDMGPQISRILDVTIVYPDGVIDFWPFICGGGGEVRICVRSLPVSPELVGDYGSDRKFRAGFHKWLNNLWTEKDQRIEQMLDSRSDRLDPSSGAVAESADCC